MGLIELLQWQWQGYEKYHRSRANLLLHIVAVPMFIAGNIILVFALLNYSILLEMLAVACIFGSIILQGKGHSWEVNPPEPFTGAGNTVARVVFEQWITFPRFVLSGAWWAAYRQASQNTSSPTKPPEN